MPSGVQNRSMQDNGSADGTLTEILTAADSLVHNSTNRHAFRSASYQPFVVSYLGRLRQLTFDGGFNNMRHASRVLFRGIALTNCDS